MNVNSLTKAAAVFALALGIMSVNWHRNDTNSMPASVENAAAARTFVEKNGYVIGQQSPGQLEAFKNGCSVLVKSLAPQGWNESQMIVMSSGRSLIFVTGGMTFKSRQPIYLTWAKFQLQRVLASLGYRSPRIAVYGVALTESCDSAATDWSSLTTPSFVMLDSVYRLVSE